MSLEMRDIPKNMVVYIDSNIFIYDATGHSNYGEKCKEFLRRLERMELKGITSTLTINEVLHRLTIIELAEKEDVEPRAVLRLIKETPSVLTKASNSFMFIEKLCELPNLDFVVYTREIAFLGVILAKKYFLMSNDATHVATMKTHGITDIVTNDPDFERVEGIKVWKP
jgi:predicted nucleic acid-binding protein